MFVHILCSKLNLTLVFVSDPLNIIRLSKIHPPEEINFPLPDLYHDIVILLYLRDCLNQQDAQHMESLEWIPQVNSSQGSGCSRC